MNVRTTTGDARVRVNKNQVLEIAFRHDDDPRDWGEIPYLQTAYTVLPNATDASVRRTVCQWANDG